MKLTNLVATFTLGSLALFGCSKEKKKPILGTYEGTAKVNARGEDTPKKDFTGVRLTIEPHVTKTPLGKSETSDSEVSITVEGGPFAKPCHLVGMIGVGDDKTLPIAGSDLCAIKVDDFSSDMAFSPMLTLFGADEVRGSDTQDIGSPIRSVKIELSAKRKP